MEVKEYQDKALSTAIYKGQYSIIYPTLGISGESGEIAEKIKKVLRDKDSVFSDETKLEIAKEICDVLWYCNALSRDLGFTLEQVMQMNIDKLESRVQRNLISGNGDNR